jgi:N-acetylneuraminic acid mutarotase
MVWDQIRNKVIMFGGSDGASKNDLWWYDPVSNTWTQMIAQGVDSSPSARQNHSMVWDPIGQRVIMFGGSDGVYKNDLWWYDPALNTWTEKTPASSPPARFAHSMVWDSIGQRVIMFGGSDASGCKNDIWWYDPALNTWSEKTPINLPSARYGHSMVWDGSRMIMFGGYGTSPTYKNDLWWYDPVSNTWIGPIATSGDGPPSARAYHSMVWDMVGQRVIMFGGYGTSPTYKNDLWWYNPVSNTWIGPIATGGDGPPSARRYHSMVWDTVGQRVIMFGGYDGAYKNDLWWYDPTSGTNGAWIDKTTTAIFPTARNGHSMVWYSIGNRVIMFGGYDGVYKNDLWWYDPMSNTWDGPIATGGDGPPSARAYHSMVWDTVGQRVIMFGGYDGAYKNDLWWYNPVSNTWEGPIATGGDGPPSVRAYHSMVWDTVGQRMIMFGGSDGVGVYKNDLWWYDPALNTWTEKTPANSPPARSAHSMVWDNTRVIMFGGAGNGYKNDLWWYEPVSNTWTEKTPVSFPSIRQNHSMVWDTIRNKVIMFGGSGTAQTYKNDLWWYDPVSNIWIQQYTNVIPSVRDKHSMVWDPIGQRMIMFGGSSNNPTYMNDLWWW